MQKPSPHLLWLSPMIGLVLGYGAYLAYASGYQGVVLSIRSGRLRTLGRTYSAGRAPAAFWLAVAWNAFVALAACIAAAMTLWWAASAEVVLSVLAFSLFVSVLGLSELLYRLAFRALLRGVMPGKHRFYRRDRQPRRYWASILACLLAFLFPLMFTCLLGILWWATGLTLR